MRQTLRGLIEYLRAFFWVPTEKVRRVTVLEVPVDGFTHRLQIVEIQRLYFGRWGRFRWRAVSRHANFQP